MGGPLLTAAYRPPKTPHQHADVLAQLDVDAAVGKAAAQQAVGAALVAGALGGLALLPLQAVKAPRVIWRCVEQRNSLA